MSTMPSFVLRTLGSLRLERADGQEVEALANRRLKLALLTILAVARRPMSRDRLVDLFWGDRSESRARHSLSEALSQLRGVLGPQAIRARQSEIALTDHALIEVDLRALATAAASHDWPRVIALYAGPFLDGIYIDGSPEWEQWVLAQRQGAAQLFDGACRGESERMTAASEWEALHSLCAKWLQHSPLEPRAACGLLTAIARSGGPDEASIARITEAYEALSLRLAAEHGLPPSAVVTQCRDELVTALGAARDAVTPMREMPTAAHQPPTDERAAHDTAAVPPDVSAFPNAPGGARRSIRRRTASPRVASLRIAVGLTLGVVGISSAWYSWTRPQATREELPPQAVTAAMAQRNLALRYERDGTRSTAVTQALTRAVALAADVDSGQQNAILSTYHLLVSGDFAQAAEHQRALLQRKPDDANAWHELGMTYQYLGDEARAAEAYRESLARDPDSPSTWANLIDALYAIGDSSAVGSALSGMAATIPGHPTLFSTTARVRAANGQLGAAEVQARAYLAATITRPRAQGIGEMLLSRVLWTQGRLDEGDAAIRRGIERQVEVGDSVMALRESLAYAISAFWLRDDAAEARRRMTAAVRRFPIETLPFIDRPYADLAIAQALAGDLVGATKSLESYNRLIPEAARRKSAGLEALARGTVALRGGRIRESILHLQSANTADCPACGLPELAQAYSQLGDATAARAAAARYLAYPTLRRTDLQDALHRRRLEARPRRITD